MTPDLICFADPALFQGIERCQVVKGSLGTELEEGRVNFALYEEGKTELIEQVIYYIDFWHLANYNLYAILFIIFVGIVFTEVVMIFAG